MFLSTIHVCTIGLIPGFVTSDVSILFRWYKRSESQKRFSFFFSSTTLAGAFGGLLASAIGNMDGMRGYRGWRWVFILGMFRQIIFLASCSRFDFCAEGVLTALVGILFYFLICDFPEEAAWLTQEERNFVKTRLRKDVGESQRYKSLTLKDVLVVISDCKHR